MKRESKGETEHRPAAPARMPRRPWRSIVDHCETTYPREACGALLGHVGATGIEVRRAVPLENAAADAARGFRLRPEDVYELLSAEARGAHRLLGFYHSHPDAESEPSATDRRLAWPAYVNLIVEVRAGRATGASMWTSPRARGSIPCPR